jgi:very-short-patch-repair endonuclease
MAATGPLERVHEAVFMVRGSPDSYSARLWTAVLAVDGVIGFATAAHLHGFDERPPLIHVIRPDLDHVDRPVDVRLHRVVVPDAAVTDLDGLPVTTPRWTLLDHLGRLRRHEAFRLADRAFQRGWLDPADLADRVRLFKGKQGNAQLRLILRRADDGAAAESERLLHRLLRRTGIVGWRANHRVRSGGRIVAVVDVAFPAEHVAVEVDGWAFHTDVDRFRRDRERQNALVALGWTVLRFTAADLTERPDYVRDTIRVAIVAAQGRLASTSGRDRASGR